MKKPLLRTREIIQIKSSNDCHNSIISVVLAFMVLVLIVNVYFGINQRNYYDAINSFYDNMLLVFQVNMPSSARTDTCRLYSGTYVPMSCVRLPSNDTSLAFCEEPYTDGIKSLDMLTLEIDDYNYHFGNATDFIFNGLKASSDLRLYLYPNYTCTFSNLHLYEFSNPDTTYDGKELQNIMITKGDGDKLYIVIAWGNDDKIESFTDIELPEWYSRWCQDHGYGGKK